MGAILLIDDNKNLHHLMEKILPLAHWETFRALPNDEMESPGSQKGHAHEIQENTTTGLDGAIKRFVQQELQTGEEARTFASIVAEVEKTIIQIALEEERGNQLRAAKRLGMNRNTLRKKIKDFKILTRVITAAD
jgi:two-component system, NtrC family, nitrogen regulation response regulator GlnG